MSEEMTDSELMDFICVMKRKARRAQRGRVHRVAYSDNDRQQTMKLLDSFSARGDENAIKTVCEMLSLNESTLMGWLDKFTDPQCDWHLRDIATRLRNKLFHDSLEVN